MTHPHLILALDNEWFSIAVLVIMFVIGLISQVVNSLRKKGDRPEEEVVDFNIDDLFGKDNHPAAPIAMPVAPQIGPATPQPPIRLKPVAPVPQAVSSPPRPQVDPQISKPRRRRPPSHPGVHRMLRSRSSLRQAIVLSEVLASPVGLRENPPG